MNNNANQLYPIIRLIAALSLMTMGGAAMYATIVVLKPVAAEFAVNRGIGSLPYTLFMVGFGSGGVIMGRVADRYGVQLPIAIASFALPAGFYFAAQATTLWQFSLAIALLCGLLGAASTFSPIVADISHWFSKRRGLAVGIVISGTYFAGALWPPIVQYLLDQQGWRATFEDFALLTLCLMLPLTILFYRKPVISHDDAVFNTSERGSHPLGFRPFTLQSAICLAGIGCCAAMAVPQVHIVAHTTDLGYAAAHGTLMLSLMLGFGIVSRMVSGYISDTIGGLRTLMLGSMLQAFVLAGFLTTDALTGLYILAIAFGLSQGGIVPSYAIIIRSFFPASQAGWRIGMALFFTIIGMALGGWIAGALYDLSGSYTLSFIIAILFNILNLAIALMLLKRAQTISAKAQLAY